MNRKILVSASLVFAFAVFLVGGWIITQQDNSIATPSMIGEVSQGASAIIDDNRALQDGLIRSYSPIMGPKAAPVTIVEFFDPACEACRAFYPILKGIMADYPDDVRVIIRYTPFHGEGSELAIRILEAARLQNLFVPVKEALLNTQQEWASHGSPDTNKILSIAASAGLNMEEALIQIKSPSIFGILNQDRMDVQTMGIKQTPTFFINGAPMENFGANELIEQVREAVEQSRGTIE